jgi:hypothetical protein
MPRVPRPLALTVLALLASTACAKPSENGGVSALPEATVSPTATSTPAPSAATLPTVASSAPPSTDTLPRPMPARPGIDDKPLDVDALGGFHIGARVRLKKRDRALDPDETGYAKRVAYGPGQQGVVVRFLHRRMTKLSVEFDVAVVRWDAQTWYEWDTPLNQMKEGVVYSGGDINRMNGENGPPVSLPSFEAAAHPELLESTDPDAAAAPPAPAALGDPPKHVRCAPPLGKVEGRYVLFVRDDGHTQEIADDLGARIHIHVLRVWDALASFSADMSPAQLAEVLKDRRLREVDDDCVG